MIFHLATAGFPVGDWQFWAASGAAFAALFFLTWPVVRWALRCTGLARRPRGGTVRVRLTINSAQHNEP